MAKMKRASLVISLVMAAAVIDIIIGAVSARVSWLPPSSRSTMLQRTFGGDPAAQNLPYVLATFEAVNWYERAVVPGLAGLIVGLLSLTSPTLSLRELLYIAVTGCTIPLLKYGLSEAPQWFGALLFTASTLGGGSLRSRHEPAAGMAS